MVSDAIWMCHGCQCCPLVVMDMTSMWIGAHFRCLLVDAGKSLRNATNLDETLHSIRRKEKLVDGVPGTDANGDAFSLRSQTQHRIHSTETGQNFSI